MSVREKAFYFINKSSGGEGWAQANAQRAIALAILDLADAVRSRDTSEKRIPEEN